MRLLTLKAFLCSLVSGLIFAPVHGITIQADVFPMAEFPAVHRSQILTKGYDSAENSWSLEYSRGKYNGKSAIVFRRNKGKGISGKAELELFRTSRITLCTEGGKAELYLNGEKIAEREDVTVPVNQYPLLTGRYYGREHAFPGRISGVKILEETVRPEKFNSAGDNTVLLKYRAPAKKIPLEPVRGKWFMDQLGYGEFSDDPDVQALAVCDRKMPDNFVYTVRVITFDQLGEIILEFCRQDQDNCYRLVVGADNMKRFAKLYKVQNGKVSLLAMKTSETVKIPVSGKKTAPLTLSVGRQNDMIHFWINSNEIFNALDSRFKNGGIAFGLHERKAQIAELSVVNYSGYCVRNQPVPLPDHEILLNTDSLRTVFYPDEKIRLTAEIINRSSNPVPGEKAEIEFNKNRKSQTFDAVPPAGSVKRYFELDCRDLLIGENTVRIRCGKLSAELKLTLVSRPVEEPYRFYNWTRADLDRLKQFDFNGGSLNISPRDDIEYCRKTVAACCDQAMKNNLSQSLHIALLTAVPEGGSDMCIVRKDGTRSNILNARNEKTVKYLCDGVEKIAAMIKDYPAFRRVLLDSEIENFLEQGYSKADIARAREELGFEPPMSETASVEIDNTAGRRISVPKKVKQSIPTVFPPDNRHYLFMKWFWERGAGDNLIRTKLAEIIRKTCPGMIVYHDPYRNVPLSSRMAGMDVPGTWYYCHPDAGETFMAVETLLSACRTANKPEQFQLDPSMWLYSYQIGPAKSRWAGVQPANIYLTALHLSLASKPYMLELYDLNFLLPEIRPQPQFKEKQTLTMIQGFIRNFVRPLWSPIQHLDREQPKTALMLSFGSQIFSRSQWGGWGQAPANTILNLFWKAHIPTAVLTEEGVRNGELARYDRILLYRTSHLPQDVFDRIKTFAAKGGTVLTEPDSPWAKLIPSAVTFPIETKKITNSSFYQIRKKGGFTADIVYAEQQRIARALRKFRKDNSGFADSSSTELYIRTLQADHCRYVFLMNDRRTFGNYFGKKYKAVYDAGLPLTAEITLPAEDAVYEFPAQKKHLLKNGRLTLDFKPVEGKVLIIYPDAVSAVKIGRIPTFTARKPAVFEIAVLNSKQQKLNGIQPVRVVLTKPDGGKTEHFTSAVNGTASFTFIPAGNEPAGPWKLEAEELASGTKTVQSWMR